MRATYKNHQVWAERIEELDTGGRGVTFGQCLNVGKERSADALAKILKQQILNDEFKEEQVVLLKKMAAAQHKSMAEIIRCSGLNGLTKRCIMLQWGSCLLPTGKN